MISRKVGQHLDDKLKNLICMIKVWKYDLKYIFAILKIEKVKTILSAVKRIGKKFQLKAHETGKLVQVAPKLPQ